MEHLGADDDFEDVHVNQTDLGHSWNRDMEVKHQMPSWIVFTNTHRHPIVSGVIPLPHQIGALFTRHVVDWSPKGVQQLALEGFKIFVIGLCL